MMMNSAVTFFVLLQIGGTDAIRVMVRNDSSSQDLESSSSEPVPMLKPVERQESGDSTGYNSSEAGDYFESLSDEGSTVSVPVLPPPEKTEMEIETKLQLVSDLNSYFKPAPVPRKSCLKRSPSTAKSVRFNDEVDVKHFVKDFVTRHSGEIRFDPKAYNETSAGQKHPIHGEDGSRVALPDVVLTETLLHEVLTSTIDSASKTMSTVSKNKSEIFQVTMTGLIMSGILYMNHINQDDDMQHHPLTFD